MRCHWSYMKEGSLLLSKTRRQWRMCQFQERRGRMIECIYVWLCISSSQKKIQSSCTKNSSLGKFVGLLISTFLLHNNRVDVHWLPWEVFVEELKYVSATIAQLDNCVYIILVNEACAIKYMKIVGIAKLNVRLLDLKQ